MRPHGKNGFLVKCEITKNKERPTIELCEILPMVLMIRQTDL